ncbi:MAG: hypothetical protein V5B40_19435 [Candidatus Accumulibacter meliphilus]|jgi:hypothetical protein|uniref:hypothetical protein n=1 Tax=Candidatus Accumulibacter meliphilus TaxID=2211374 RepID=UPI002FC277A1
MSSTSARSIRVEPESLVELLIEIVMKHGAHATGEDGGEVLGALTVIRQFRYLFLWIQNALLQIGALRSTEALANLNTLSFGARKQMVVISLADADHPQ